MIMPSKNTTVCVVDASPDDYETISHGVDEEGAKFVFKRTGRDALRLSPAANPELWIINMHLPDMSGVDLHSMIRARYPGVPVYLVGDDYDAQDELSARCCGATMYFCKPLQREWVVAADAHVAN